MKDILRRNIMEDITLEKELLRQEFVKYSNDLFFHHLLLNHEKIRTLICQEAMPDKKIISTTVRNATQYGKRHHEKKLILDLIAKAQDGTLFIIEMQTYGLSIDVTIRFELYGAEILRQQIKMGENYVDTPCLGQMIINAGKALKGYDKYKYEFVLYDKKNKKEYPHHRLKVTLIQLEYIDQILEDMSVFNQLMYLFKNEKAYDKIKADQLVEEAIEMHKEYIASDEKYQEYLDKVDNDMIINSKIRLAKMYEDENKDLKLQLHEKEETVHKLNEEKKAYHQRMRNNINCYVKKEFQKDISQWLDELSEEQLLKIEDHLYEVKNLDELKKLI